MYRYYIQLSVLDLAPVAGELRPLEAVPGVARRQPHLLPPEPRGHQPRSLHADPVTSQASWVCSSKISRKLHYESENINVPSIYSNI